MAMSAGRRGRPRFTVLIMVLASITVLTLDAKDVPVIGSIRSGALDVLSPIGSAFKTVTTPFRNAWKGVTDFDDLERENQRLRARLDEAKGDTEKTADLEEQVRKLQEQLDVKQKLAIPAVVAQVATGNFSNFDDNTAQIDQGSDAGIRVGNPVVTKGGLVGRVVRVADTRSVVQLITDPDLQLGIRVKSNDIGEGRGAGSDKPFLVYDGIDLTDTVAKGDLITTSGTERAIMPGNLHIGTVTKITRNQADQTQILEVRRSADLTRLDYVQVLDWVPTR
jgi:rod shape-determining protein MreC